MVRWVSLSALATLCLVALAMLRVAGVLGMVPATVVVSGRASRFLRSVVYVSILPLAVLAAMMWAIAGLPWASALAPLMVRRWTLLNCLNVVLDPMIILNPDVVLTVEIMAIGMVTVSVYGEVVISIIRVWATYSLGLLSNSDLSMLISMVRTTMLGISGWVTWLVRWVWLFPLVRVRLISLMTAASEPLALVVAVLILSMLAAPTDLVEMLAFGLILIGTDLFATVDALRSSCLVCMALLAVTCLFGWIIRILLMCSLPVLILVAVLLCPMSVALGMSPNSVCNFVWVWLTVPLLSVLVTEHRNVSVVVLLMQLRTIVLAVSTATSSLTLNPFPANSPCSVFGMNAQVFSSRLT